MKMVQNNGAIIEEKTVKRYIFWKLSPKFYYGIENEKSVHLFLSYHLQTLRQFWPYEFPLSKSLAPKYR